MTSVTSMTSGAATAEAALDQLAAQTIVIDGNGCVAQNVGRALVDLSVGEAAAEALPFLVGFLDDTPFDIGPLLIGADRNEQPTPLNVTGTRLGGETLVTLRDCSAAWMLDQRLMQSRNDLAITNRRLERALTAAQAASESKSRFLSSISHDLRTPLSIIIGNGELLSADTALVADPVRRDMVGDINDQAAALLGLVDDLLDTAAAESGAVSVHNEAVELAGMVEKVLRSFMGQALALGITLSLEARSLPVMLLDPRRITQVMNNLLTNALNYTPRGGTILVRGDTLEDGSVRLGVIDSGVGIAAGDLTRLGEPFYTTSNRPTRGAARSSGLGLHNCKRILSVYSGDLTIESTPGFGTSVWVRLPAHLRTDL